MCIPLRETRTASLTPGTDSISFRMPSSAAISAIHSPREIPSDKSLTRASVLPLINLFVWLFGSAARPTARSSPRRSGGACHPDDALHRTRRVLHARFRLRPRHTGSRDPQPDRFPELPLKMHEFSRDRRGDELVVFRLTRDNRPNRDGGINLLPREDRPECQRDLPRPRNPYNVHDPHAER